MKPNLYVWLDEACKNLDKSEDIVFSSMDKETQLIVNILYLVVCHHQHALLLWIDLAPTLQKLADSMRSFSEFCNAVIGRWLMTNPQPRKRMT